MPNGMLLCAFTGWAIPSFNICNNTFSLLLSLQLRHSHRDPRPEVVLSHLIEILPQACRTIGVTDPISAPVKPLPSISEIVDFCRDFHQDVGEALLKHLEILIAVPFSEKLTSSGDHVDEMEGFKCVVFLSLESCRNYWVHNKRMFLWLTENIPKRNWNALQRCLKFFCETPPLINISWRIGLFLPSSVYLRLLRRTITNYCAFSSTASELSRKSRLPRR